MSAEVFHSTSSVFIEVELQMQTTLPTFLGGGKILKHSRGKKGGPNKWLSKMLPNQARANFWLLWVSLIVMQTAAVDGSVAVPPCVPPKISETPILAPFAAQAATALASYGSN